jgi:hypothetical protein
VKEVAVVSLWCRFEIAATLIPAALTGGGDEHGQAMFTQLMDFVPLTSFARSVTIKAANIVCVASVAPSSIAPWLSRG